MRRVAGGARPPPRAARSLQEARVGRDRVRVQIPDGGWMTELLTQPFPERAMDRGVLAPGRGRRRARGQLLGGRVQVRVLEPLLHLDRRGLARARARANLEFGE